VAGLTGRSAALPTQRVHVGQRPRPGATLKSNSLRFL
jgi:hypothetical protein